MTTVRGNTIVNGDRSWELLSRPVRSDARMYGDVIYRAKAVYVPNGRAVDLVIPADVYLAWCMANPEE